MLLHFLSRGALNGRLVNLNMTFIYLKVCFDFMGVLLVDDNKGHRIIIRQACLSKYHPIHLFWGMGCCMC